MRSISILAAVFIAAIFLNVSVAQAGCNWNSQKRAWVGNCGDPGDTENNYNSTHNTANGGQGGTGVGIGVGYGQGGDASVKGSGNSSNTNLNGASATNRTELDNDIKVYGGDLTNKNYNQDTNVNGQSQSNTVKDSGNSRNDIDTRDTNVNGQSQSGYNKQGQGQAQGQDTDVNIDSHERTEYDFPVMTAAAQAAAYCGTGGASAQWQNFGVSLGQQRDSICGRFLLFQSHMALAAHAEGLLAKIRAADGVAKAYKGKAPATVVGAAEEALRTQVAEQRAAALAQLALIETELSASNTPVRRFFIAVFGSLPFPLNALTPR